MLKKNMGIGKIITNIIWGTIIAGMTGSAGFGVYKVIDNEAKKSDVKYILDINRDKQLSPDEIKRFYDETGTTPYTERLLNIVPITDLKKFLEKYK